MSEVIECRDLHQILTEDDSPVVPLDHWGLGCPFDDTYPTGPVEAVVP